MFSNNFGDPQYRGNNKQKKGVSLTDLDFEIIHHHLEFSFTKNRKDYKDVENILKEYSMYKHSKKKIDICFVDLNTEEFVIENNKENENEEIINRESEDCVKESKDVPLINYKDKDKDIDTNTFYVDDCNVKESKIFSNKKQKQKGEQVIMELNISDRKQKKKNKKKIKNKNKNMDNLPRFNEKEFPNMIKGPELAIVNSERYREDLKIYTIPKLEKEDEFPSQINKNKK
jgi:hypothetical protein